MQVPSCSMQYYGKISKTVVFCIAVKKFLNAVVLQYYNTVPNTASAQL